MTTYTRINSISALRAEQQKVQNRIYQHEQEFKRKLQQLPGQLAVAGANSVIPTFLQGKVTNTALKGGKFVIDKFFVADDKGNKSLLARATKSAVIPLVKTVFNLVVRKRL